MSIESDAAKWKSNVSRIRELDPDGTVLNGSSGNIKIFFDVAAAVFEKGIFDAENTKKQLKILRGRNTRLSGKPIAVELSSFINITERYATKTEGAFADFAKTLSSNAQATANGNSARTSSRQRQVRSSRQASANGNSTRTTSRRRQVDSARTSSRQRQVQSSRQEPLSSPLVHDNLFYCSGGDLAIDIVFGVFLVLESIAGLIFGLGIGGWIGLGIGGWIISSLWENTYTHCCMSKYPTLARLGAIILPVPGVNIISIRICELIGTIKYGDEAFVDDGFDRKKEGLIFKIYIKLLFLNEPQFVKSGKYCMAYRVILCYYVRNGFQEFAMQDRCIAALEDGMSIIEAAQILHRITGEDPQFAKAFVESLLQIPRKKKVYYGAESVIREIAQIFGLSQEEYYDLLSVFAERLSKYDSYFGKYFDQFKREYVAIKSRRW